MTTIFDTFFEIFEIPKIKYETPGRVEDNDGEICEWYIEEDYPSIEPVFFDLLCYYETYLWGKEKNTKLNSYELKHDLIKIILEEYNNTEGDLKKEIKRDIQEIFSDCYGGIKNEY